MSTAADSRPASVTPALPAEFTEEGLPSVDAAGECLTRACVHCGEPTLSAAELDESFPFA